MRFLALVFVLLAAFSGHAQSARVVDFSSQPVFEITLSAADFSGTDTTRTDSFPLFQPYAIEALTWLARNPQNAYSPFVLDSATAFTVSVHNGDPDTNTVTLDLTDSIAFNRQQVRDAVISQYLYVTYTITGDDFSDPTSGYGRLRVWMRRP